MKTNPSFARRVTRLIVFCTRASMSCTSVIAALGVETSADSLELAEESEISRRDTESQREAGLQNSESQLEPWFEFHLFLCLRASVPIHFLISNLDDRIAG